MKGISQTRLIIYCLILGFLPLIFVSMNFMSKNQSQQNLSWALSQAITDATNKNAREFVNKHVKSLYRDCNHYYIDQEIETISPLQEERETLNKVLSLGFHPSEELFRRRQQHHATGQNAISFVEGSVKAYSDFQETQESLAHPVEADFNDIKSILSRIEGVSFDETELPQNRPHLIITDWKMEKKKGPVQEVFTLDIKLIKREYLK